jgi:hypothetical protein
VRDASRRVTTPEPERPLPPSSRGFVRVLLAVLGSLGVLVGLAMLVGGGFLLWAETTQRDDDGFFQTSTERLSTATYALTEEGLDVDVGEEGDWLFEPGRLGTIRIRAERPDGRPVFVGIGPEEAVDAYLMGVAHAEVTDIDVDPFRPTYREVPGARTPARPGIRGFWAARAQGTGRQEVTWKVADGSWSAVVMNADASRGVNVDASVGARTKLVLVAAVVLLPLGALFAAGGVLLLYLGLRRRGPPPAEPEAVLPLAATAPGAAVEQTAHPVAVEAVVEPDLSRWLWVVKWFLAIPHFIVLALLWIGFVVLTIVAFFAILVTGRYPRALFDFNVGVLRWGWRVAAYAFVLNTDRYPPFTLDAVPDYPATLDVPFPERLSRGLVLVKSWLLALPHLMVVAIFFSGPGWAWHTYAGAPSLAAVLAIIAGGHLLFREKYPGDLFELLLGIYRWGLRVAAYVALMRDDYPPFRLGR